VWMQAVHSCHALENDTHHHLLSTSSMAASAPPAGRGAGEGVASRAGSSSTSWQGREVEATHVNESYRDEEPPCGRGSAVRGGGDDGSDSFTGIRAGALSVSSVDRRALVLPAIWETGDKCETGDGRGQPATRTQDDRKGLLPFVNRGCFACGSRLQGSEHASFCHPCQEWAPSRGIDSRDT
jgi:hypothetical protein